MTQGILMDIAGVLHDGKNAIEGAPAAISQIRDAGIPIRFLTNSTRRPKRVIVETLVSSDMPVADDEVMTPAEAACLWLRQHGHRPHLLVHPDLLEDFSEVPQTGSTAVVVGDAGPFFDYESMNAAFRRLEQGAPLLALAYNRVFRDADGLLSLDAGAFIKALEFASGNTALVFGKPSKPFFDAGAASMGLAPDQVIMIGDDAESDVAGAISAGLGGGVLVQSGKYRCGDETRFQPSPSFIAENLSEAVDFVLSENAEERLS